MNARFSGSWGWMAGAAAAMFLTGGCAPAQKAEPTAVAWNTSMESALADAGMHRRPILLDFYTDW